MIEIHRSFVNTWECDENGHMNVQFYAKRFDEGAQVFAALNGLPTGALLTPRRHIRYHRELHAGDSTVSVGGVAKLEDSSRVLIQILRNPISGAILTTSIDRIRIDGGDGSIDDLYHMAEEVPETAKPRGLSDMLSPSPNAEKLNAMIADGNALSTNYSLVGGHEIEMDGSLHISRIVSRFTDGAPHVWDHVGITTEWLNAHGNGRVAVEMKIEATGKVRYGDALRLVSFVPDREKRTFRVVHALQRLSDLTVVARGEVRCLVMDLKTRKAVALPDGFLD